MTKRTQKTTETVVTYVPKTLEDATKLFKKFERLDEDKNTSTEGTGLGLAITKSVILMHHGAIRVESKEGEGTVFLVRIPLIYIS